MQNNLRALFFRESSLLQRLRAWYRDKCFCLKNMIQAVTKDMCFTQEEMDEIKRRVASTKEGNVKFLEWERVAPTVAEGIAFLRSEIERLNSEKDFCIQGIYDLYVADNEEDESSKREIFARFGLPHVLEKSN